MPRSYGKIASKVLPERERGKRNNGEPSPKEEEMENSKFLTTKEEKKTLSSSNYPAAALITPR